MNRITISRKQGFNDVRVEGDTAFLIVTDRHGAFKDEVKIDATDVSMLAALGHRWGTITVTRGHTYAVSTIKGTRKFVYLHRLLTQATAKTEFVDHLNHDSLDCRRANLRVTTPSENSRNRKGASTNSQFGVRGVIPADSKTRPYRVLVNGTANSPRYSKNCTTLNIARITVEMKRVELWGVEAA